MYAVMWSEHCSYKSSRIHLAGFPTEAPWVLVGPGEGAGVIDVGDGIAVAMRIESHNHPSAVEPYQGAATGVGGILRDIFSMGARPIALMDPLRFGPLDDARSRWTVRRRRVAASAATATPSACRPSAARWCSTRRYHDNPLVNVFCLGLLPARAPRARPGRGRRQPRRAARLVHRPRRHRRRERARLGRVRREARRASDRRCRSAIRSRRSGSSRRASRCSTPASRSASRTSAAPASRARRGDRGQGRRGHGRRRRRASRSASRAWSPFEVMTSESQERMLAIVEPERPRRGARALRAGGRSAPRSSARVTDTARFRVFDGLFDASACPARTRHRRRRAAGLVGPSRSPTCRSQPRRRTGLPAPAARPADRTRRQADDPAPTLAARFPTATDLVDELLALLASPTIADKSWVWRQYDHQLFLNTVVGPGGDAAVLRLKPGTGDTRRSRSTTDGKARFCRARPAHRRPARRCSRRRATSRAPAPARSRSSNCLNFGNPEHPEVMWQFAEVDRRDERGVPRVRHPRHRRQRELLQRVARRRHRSDARRRRGRADRRARSASARAAPREAVGDRGARRRRAPSSAARSGRRVHGRRGGRRPRPTSTRRTRCTSWSPSWSRASWSAACTTASTVGSRSPLAEMAIAGGCGFRRRRSRRRASTTRLLVLRVGVAGRAVGRCRAVLDDVLAARGRPRGCPRRRSAAQVATA